MMNVPILNIRNGRTGWRVPVAMGTAIAIFTPTGCASATPTAGTALFWVQAALLLVVFLGLPALALWRGHQNSEQLRGLGLPRGSLRGMLALFIVGSTINFLLFGAKLVGDHFGEVIAALGTLSASVLGFYFGGRTASSPPDTRSTK